MQKKRTSSLKPIKSWQKNWPDQGVMNTVFVFVYKDYINWVFDEDAPWKDTVRAETDQTFHDYRENGIPVFIMESLSEKELAKIRKMISAVLNKKIRKAEH